jgi:hypothetical protein
MHDPGDSDQSTKYIQSQRLSQNRPHCVQRGEQCSPSLLRNFQQANRVSSSIHMSRLDYNAYPHEGAEVSCRWPRYRAFRGMYSNARLEVE